MHNDFFSNGFFFQEGFGSSEFRQPSNPTAGFDRDRRQPSDRTVESPWPTPFPFDNADGQPFDPDNLNSELSPSKPHPRTARNRDRAFPLASNPLASNGAGEGADRNPADCPDAIAPVNPPRDAQPTLPLQVTLEGRVEFPLDLLGAAWQQPENADRFSAAILRDRLARAGLQQRQFRPLEAAATLARLLDSGEALVRTERPQDALDAFETALRLDERSDRAWIGKGHALYDQHRYAAAIGAYRQATELNPHAIAAWNGLGNALDELGQHAAALAAYDRALQIDALDSIVWFNRGMSLYRQQEYEAAAQAYHRALAFDRDRADVWFNLGMALAQLQRYENALQCFTETVGIDPCYAEGWFNRGLVLELLGEFDAALASFDRAIQVKPDCPEARERLDRDWDGEAENAARAASATDGEEADGKTNRLARWRSQLAAWYVDF